MKTKAEQDTEAAARNAGQERDPNEDYSGAADGVFADREGGDDNGGMPDRGSQRQDDPDDQPQMPKPRVDDRRAAIVARFKESRNEADEDGETDAEQLMRFARNGLPPEMVPQPAAQDDAAQDGDQGGDQNDTAAKDEPAPKRKLKVRGQEVELTEEEILVAAQRGLAGDSYLDEAREKMDRVNALIREAEQRQRGSSAAGTHPAGDDAASEGDQDHGDSGDGEHPADDELSKLVEKVQFGDPKEVGKELGSYIEKAAAKQSRQALIEERVQDETVRSTKVLDDFKAAHPELDGDEDAQAVIESKLYRLQRDELVALGIKPEAMPKTNVEIAQWHRYYRANGYKVTSTADMLTKAHEAFLAWKGVPPKKDPVEKAPARVEVTVDREARRKAIQTQPTRSAAPRRPEAPPEMSPEDRRSSVVQRMQMQRSKGRGVAV